MSMCRYMSSRTVSLQVSAYERLRAAKRPGESFTQTINRILRESRPSFRVLAGALSPKDAAAVRDAIAEMRESEAPAEARKLAAFGSYRRGRHA